MLITGCLASLPQLMLLYIRVTVQIARNRSLFLRHEAPNLEVWLGVAPLPNQWVLATDRARGSSCTLLLVDGSACWVALLSLEEVERVVS